MKRLVLAAGLTCLCLAPTYANAKDALSPVFGAAKVRTVGPAEAAKVVGKGTTSDYYGYYGNYYSAYASLYGSIGQYYNSQSNESYYYYYAYYYAYYAMNNYYYAYYYAGS